MAKKNQFIINQMNKGMNEADARNVCNEDSGPSTHQRKKRGQKRRRDYSRARHSRY